MLNRGLCAVAAIGFAMNVAASPVSCDDLTDMADALDVVADAFANIGEEGIETGGYMDTQLGTLTAALMDVAAVEGDAGLTRNVNGMAWAWENQDADTFQTSMDNVIDAMDRLYYRDCE